jgi:hypothetical protein
MNKKKKASRARGLGSDSGLDLAISRFTNSLVCMCSTSNTLVELGPAWQQMTDDRWVSQKRIYQEKVGFLCGWLLSH